MKTKQLITNIVLAGLLAARGVLAADLGKPDNPPQMSAGITQPQTAGPIVKSGMRIAFTGDSITAQMIYTRFLELYLTACVPQKDLKIMQFGKPSERAGLLVKRMENDIVPFKPDIVTTCYGMNDGRYVPFTPQIGVDYETPMREIVSRFKSSGAIVVVGSPGTVDTRSNHFSNGYTETLAQLRDIARKIAADNGMPFANVHDPMVETMAKAQAVRGKGFDVCGTDGVHPRDDGHLIMAYAFLKGMGFDGNLATFRVDLKGEATATEGHKVISAKNGVAELESTRYPFCFAGDGKSPESARSILPFLPFNQELNRFMLVVTNLGAPKAKVAWGNAEKEFSREQLEAGINLAAEFLDNPFSAAFQKINDAVAAKQKLEAVMIREVFPILPTIVSALDDDPEVKAQMGTLRERFTAKWNKRNLEVHEAVVPVRHSLRITPVAAGGN
ncbi:MAG: SGNH/GDSL hydrolase family protein [Verrucomicrobiota bacterium]